MDYALMFPGRFLKSVEFKGRDVTLTISKVYTEEIEDKKGVKTKGILKFEGTKKEMVLNRTNAECLKAMFGRETDGWLGKRVTFFPAPYVDNTTGEQTTAIRVRGSPDLKQDVTATIALPQRKPVDMRLKRTGQQARPTQQQRQAKPTPPPEPPHDPVTGEVPFGDDDAPPPSDSDAPPPGFEAAGGAA